MVACILPKCAVKGFSLFEPERNHGVSTRSFDLPTFDEIKATRRDFLSTAVMIPLVSFPDVARSTTNPPSKEAIVDYKAVANDIGDMIARVPYRGPPLVRLAWHASGTFDATNGIPGGSNGGTIRFEEELAHTENAGLRQSAVRWLEPIHAKYKGISYADLYTLAGGKIL